jgi:hypothetical protein
MALKLNSVFKKRKFGVTIKSDAYFLDVSEELALKEENQTCKSEVDFLDCLNISPIEKREIVFNKLMQTITEAGMRNNAVQFAHDGRWGFRNSVHASSKNIRHAYFIKSLIEVLLGLVLIVTESGIMPFFIFSSICLAD